MNMMQRSRDEVFPSSKLNVTTSQVYDMSLPKSRVLDGPGADKIILSFVHRKKSQHLLQVRASLITAHLLQAHWSKRATSSCAKARLNLLSNKVISLYHYYIFLLLKLEQDFYELDFKGLVFPQGPFWEQQALLWARPQKYGRIQRLEAGQEEFNRNCFFPS